MPGTNLGQGAVDPIDDPVIPAVPVEGAPPLAQAEGPLSTEPLAAETPVSPDAGLPPATPDIPAAPPEVPGLTEEPPASPPTSPTGQPVAVSPDGIPIAAEHVTAASSGQPGGLQKLEGELVQKTDSQTLAEPAPPVAPAEPAVSPESPIAAEENENSIQEISPEDFQRLCAAYADFMELAVELTRGVATSKMEYLKTSLGLLVKYLNPPEMLTPNSNVSSQIEQGSGAAGSTG